MLILLRSSLRYWQQHRWQAVLMLVGIALGVAVVFSVDIATYSCVVNLVSEKVRRWLKVSLKYTVAITVRRLH